MKNRLQFGLMDVGLFVFVVLAIGSTPPASTDWPKWRGVNTDGKAFHHVLKFDPGYGLKIAWKKPLGSGYSSVSVADNRAVTMFSDSTFDYVIAFDAANGSEIWRFKMDSTYVGHDGSHTGPISTPVIDGEKVFALCPHGRLFALGLKTGKLLWAVDLVKDHKSLAPHYGFTTAPLVHQKVLIVQTGGSQNNMISGLDKKSGKVLWSAGSDTASYQSPAILNLAGEEQLVALGNKRIYGLNPSTGKVLWEYQYNGEENTCTPLLVDSDKIFVEYRENESKLLQVKKENGAYQIGELWKSGNIKQSYNPTVFHNGYLFGYSSRFLTCVDARTGESIWKTRQPGEGFVILVDGFLVIQSRDGILRVAEASPAGYKEIANLIVFERLAWTPPSFANGRIFVRSHFEIASIEVGKVDQVMAVEVKPQPKPLLPNSKFAAFVKEVEQAADKKVLIDDFMAKNTQFPIIESDNLVHFVYRGEVKDLVITSDLFNLNDEKVMQRIEGTDFYYYSAEAAPDAYLAYQFVRNFEERIADPLNSRKGTSFNGENAVFAMPRWQPETHFDEPTGVTRGRIDTLQFESKILQNKRKIAIYLPPDYDKSTARYPVLYVNYGRQAMEWGDMPNTLDNLVGKTVAPVMAVFIHLNPQAGFSDVVGPNKTKYAQMVVEELVPYIDQNYRTIANADARAILGGSSAGSISILTAFKHPGVFNLVAGHSTNFDPPRDAELTELVTKSEKLPVRFYLHWGNYDLRDPHQTLDRAGVNAKFFEMLKQKGYAVYGGPFNEGYGYASWRTRNDDILEAFFPIQKTQM